MTDETPKPKAPKLSLEERLINQELRRRAREEKENSKKERAAIREQRREEKRQIDEQKAILKAQPKKTEAELVRQAANTIIRKQTTRGMLANQFRELHQGPTLNKELWKQTDFFFSVVFESNDQKYQFLDFLVEKFGIELPADQNYEFSQIVNGVKLAEAMGCVLKKEYAKEFPAGNLELRELILDEEQI